MIDSSNPLSPGSPRPTLGWIGFLAGAAAFLLVLVQFYAGPFAPQQDVATSISEIAAEIRQSAMRAMAGEPQPAPVTAPWDIDRVLATAAAVLAGGAVILGLAALMRGELRRTASAAIGLGVAAVTFQFLTWLVLLIAGVILLSAIIYNIGDILGG